MRLNLTEDKVNSIECSLGTETQRDKQGNNAGNKQYQRSKGKEEGIGQKQYFEEMPVDNFLKLIKRY